MAGANRRNGPWDREWDFIACITHSVGLRPYFEYSPCRWQDTLIWIQYSSVTVTQLLAYLCTFVRFREFPRMCQKVDVFLSKCVKMTDGYWAPKLNGCDVRERGAMETAVYSPLTPESILLPRKHLVKSRRREIFVIAFVCLSRHSEFWAAVGKLAR